MWRRLAAVWADIVLALGLLAIASSMVWMADDFGPEARRLPFVVGIPLIGLALANLALVTGRALRGPLAHKGDGDRPSSAAAIGEGDGEAVQQLDRKAFEEAAEQAAAEAEIAETEGLALHWTLASLATVVAMFYFFGLVVTAFVYTAGFMRLVGKQPWRKIVLLVAVLMLLLYVFSEVLGVTIYDGWLFDEDILPDIVPFG